MSMFWWIFLGFRRLVIGFVVLILIIIALRSVRVVPPISGRLVDAVSGKPAAEMDVCLEVHILDWGKYKVVRSEVTTSNASGEFSFSPSIHNTAGFRAWEGYSITVTDPNAAMVPTCGNIIGEFAMFGVRLDQGRAPWAPTNSSKQVYFPSEFSQDPNPIDPVNQKMKHFWGGEIGLIPLLQNAGECQGIQDSSLAPFCREMNNSAMASLMRKAIQPDSAIQ